MIQEENAYDQQLEQRVWDPNIIQLEDEEKLIESLDICGDSKKIDPFQILPTEILTDIMLLLPQDDIRVHCLRVSKLWWNQILGCTELWNVILLHDVEKDSALLPLISYLGYRVKDLTILPSASESVQSKFMTLLRKGHFKTIRAVNLSESAVHHFRPKLTPNLEVTDIFSFWKLENTLTRLEINVGINDGRYPIYVADILQVFNNLTNLYYTIAAKFYFSKHNESIMMTPHQHLINLQIRGYHIEREQAELIAHHCPQLRRLFMYHCQPSVLDTIVKLQHSDTSATLQYLETLIVNSDDTPRHPPFLMFPQKLTTTGTTAIEEKKRKRGIRILHANTIQSSNPASSIFQLINANKHTLETLVGSFQETQHGINRFRHAEVQQTFEVYPDFKLTNLRNITFWYYQGSLKDILLRSIRGSTSLKRLEIQDSIGLNGPILDILLEIPPLDHLGFSASEAIFLEGNYEKLIRLFKKYAQHSENNGSSVKSIAIRDYNSVITDPVLDTLSNINSLEEIWLTGRFYKVSTEQIHRLITKLGEQKLRGICFQDIGGPESEIPLDVVLDDDTINNLEWIHLWILPRITDDGMRALIDKIEKNSRLTFIVNNCPNVTPKCISYVRKKVRTLIFNEACNLFHLRTFDNK
ncbi:hypothetical protein BDA99DRAFT_523139 [Phascolomyces articulosus]|uniref:F-box domain-containing protein n=1 Tax=Phascolomyces articulosus TaxID=60185 RepID=A0AAD5P9B1_9FUNG|nr:hypothetical protein BDA99DRAFT_523139 [Phascolomyces articulosus]